MPTPNDEKILNSFSSPPYNIWNVRSTLKEGYAFLGQVSNEEFNSDEILSKLMGCSMEECKELRETLSSSNIKFLYEGEEDFKNVNIFTLPDDKINLESIKVMKKIKPKPKILTNVCHITPKETSKASEVDGELLLSVAIYTPRTTQKSQEFLVLSSQCLCELRDVISCSTDEIYIEDHSENPGLLNPLKIKDVCCSGYFFINNTFYNDMRNGKNSDYSKSIFDWIIRENLNDTDPYSTYTSAKMEHTRFSDLTLRVGYPYLYCHQGNCEHLLVFTELRLINKEDPQGLSQYPRMIFKKKPYKPLCMMCKMFPARWITRNDKLSFKDPSFFCDKCFDYLHYDEEHKKMCEFQAYPFNRE